MAVIALAAIASLSTAQSEEAKPRASRYALTIRVHLETQLPKVLAIGSKQYLEPVDIKLGATARFLLTQKLWSSPDGDHGELKVDRVTVEPVKTNGDAEPSSLRAAFERVVEGWKTVEGQSYGSRRPPGSHAWPPALSLVLEEEPPRYLTAWLGEALQPVPFASISEAERAWSRTDPSFEVPERQFTSEELRQEFFHGELAHVWDAATSLTGGRPQAQLAPELREQGVQVLLNFIAEEQDTISAEDGRLIRAVRSASRDTTWVLPAKRGNRRPMFEARMACAVTIEELE